MSEISPSPATPPLPPSPGRPLPLWGALLLASCGGGTGALGTGIVRASVHGAEYLDGGLSALGLLVGLGLGTLLLGVAFFVAGTAAGLLRGSAERPPRVAVETLVLGGTAMIALNSVLTSSASLPPFGAVSSVLLCLPYPMAFAFLVAPRRRRATATLAILLGVVAFAVRSGQEHLAAQSWLADHPALDRGLLRAVDWPGGEQDPFEVGPYGVRSAVFFPDSSIDGVDDAIVTVAPTTATPCAGLAAVPSDDFGTSGPYGVTVVPLTQCTRVGADAWTLRTASGWAGYAERRDGVLLTLSVNADTRPDDDLPAIARTLHPLDDHTLWPHLAGVDGWVRLLL